MKILSLAQSNTEILYALGAEDQVVANTKYCDHPPHAKDKPKVGGWLDVKDDLIREYHPDIILTSILVQDKIISRLELMGVEVVHIDPITLDDVYASIIRIGRLVEKDEEAQQIVDEMKQKLEDLRQKSLKLPRLKVYCEEWHNPSTVAGNWVPEIIQIAGGDPILINEGERSKEILQEQVIAENPDFVILSLTGIGALANVDEVKKREGWNVITAVQQNNVIAINDALLNRPSMRLVEGAQLLFDFFHQEKE